MYRRKSGQGQRLVKVVEGVEDADLAVRRLCYKFDSRGNSLSDSLMLLTILETQIQVETRRSSS